MTKNMDFGLKMGEPTGSILNDACQIIETAQRTAYKAVDSILVRRNGLFHKSWSEIFHSASGKLNLPSLTHCRVLLQVNDEQTRLWYEQEASSQTWCVKTLQRNISSQYYYRLLQSQKKDLVENETTAQGWRSIVVERGNCLKNSSRSKRCISR